MSDANVLNKRIGKGGAVARGILNNDVEPRDGLAPGAVGLQSVSWVGGCVKTNPILELSSF